MNDWILGLSVGGFVVYSVFIIRWLHASAKYMQTLEKIMQQWKVKE